MNRQTVQSSVAQHRIEIQQRFNVQELFLFGSVVRNEASESSDIDMLVKFKGEATFDGYMDLKFFLEDLLGREIDLVTEKAVKARLRPYILKEAVRVA